MWSRITSEDCCPLICALFTNPGTSARAWWQYALRAVRVRYLARTRGSSWSTLSMVCSLRKRYVPHYAKCLAEAVSAPGGSRAEAVGGDSAIAAMDAQLEEATILVFRWVVVVQMRSIVSRERELSCSVSILLRQIFWHAWWLCKHSQRVTHHLNHTHAFYAAGAWPTPACAAWRLLLQTLTHPEEASQPPLLPSSKPGLLGWDGAVLLQQQQLLQRKRQGVSWGQRSGDGWRSCWRAK